MALAGSSRTCDVQRTLDNKCAGTICLWIGEEVGGEAAESQYRNHVVLTGDTWWM